MIFTVPGPILKGSTTLDGGEHLPSDAERERLFGQRDHLKQFGADLFEFLRDLDSVDFTESVAIPEQLVSAHRAGERVMLAQKRGTPESH